MKHLKYIIAGLLFTTVSYAAQLNHYQQGPRLIDGTQLNLMVDQVNNLTGNGTPSPISASILSVGNGTVAAPSVTFTSDTNTGLYRIGADNIGIAAAGAKVLDIGTTGLGITGVNTITSVSATALAVGRLGATTPALVVDASAATSITGIKITSAAAGAGVAIAAVGETNINTTINAAGSGTLTLNGTATGNIVLGRAATGVSASVTGLLTSRSATATPAAASAVPALLFSSTANLGIYWGTGSPSTALTAAKGSIYIRTDGSTTNDRVYVNTDGSTAWTNITTAG